MCDVPESELNAWEFAQAMRYLSDVVKVDKDNRGELMQTRRFWSFWGGVFGGLNIRFLGAIRSFDDGVYFAIGDYESLKCSLNSGQDVWGCYEAYTTVHKLNPNISNPRIASLFESMINMSRKEFETV